MENYLFRYKINDTILEGDLLKSLEADFDLIEEIENKENTFYVYKILNTEQYTDIDDATEEINSILQKYEGINITEEKYIFQTEIEAEEEFDDYEDEEYREEEEDYDDDYCSEISSNLEWDNGYDYYEEQSKRRQSSSIVYGIIVKRKANSFKEIHDDPYCNLIEGLSVNDTFADWNCPEFERDYQKVQNLINTKGNRLIRKKSFRN